LREQSSLALRAWRKCRKRLGLMPQEEAWLCRQKPDLVIVSQGGIDDGVVWLEFCHCAGLPSVSVVQANNEQWWPADNLRNEMSSGYRSARKVFCVSRHNLELLERQLGESLPNAGLVWNPVNVPTGQPPAWPNEDGVWKLACVARLDPAAKGQDLLFQALAQAKWRERPLEVNLFGEGQSEHGLKKLASHLQIKNIHFRGHVPDVRQIWEDNHMLVLPSRYEGLPLALVEAMWCGRPVLVTNVGGNAEMCVDGQTGFVASAPAASLLEETLERAWNFRTAWQGMGMAGRTRAEQLIPKDAVGVFCEQLLECAKKTQNPPALDLHPLA
jgi:glycosyltransferase involved in cell wall biosynthesis